MEKNIRDVHELLKELEGVENKGELKIELSSYRTTQGKELPMYILNKQAFTFLIMGYTGAKATQFKLDYLKAFEKMEAYIRTIGKCLLTTKEIAKRECKTIKKEIGRIKKQVNVGLFLFFL